MRNIRLILKELRDFIPHSDFWGWGRKSETSETVGSICNAQGRSVKWEYAFKTD